MASSSYALSVRFAIGYTSNHPELDGVNVELDLYAPNLGHVTFVRPLQRPNPHVGLLVGVMQGKLSPEEYKAGLEAERTPWLLERILDANDVKYSGSLDSLLHNKQITISGVDYSKTLSILQNNGIIDRSFRSSLKASEVLCKSYKKMCSKSIDDFSAHQSLKDGLMEFLEPYVSEFVEGSGLQETTLKQIKKICIHLHSNREGKPLNEDERKKDLESTMSYFRGLSYDKTTVKDPDEFYRAAAWISKVYGGSTWMERSFFRRLSGKLPTINAQRKLMLDMIKKAFFAKFEIVDALEKFRIVFEMNSIAMDHNFSSVGFWGQACNSAIFRSYRESLGSGLLGVRPPWGQASLGSGLTIVPTFPLGFLVGRFGGS